MSGSDNDVIYGLNVNFSTAGALGGAATIVTNGQMLIGTTALNAGGTHINVGTITSPLGTLTIGYSTPNITIDLVGGGAALETLTGNTGVATPVSNNINTIGTATNGINTVGSANNMTIAFSGLFADGNQEFRSSVSGTTRTVSVTNTSNTASSQAQLTTSVAGTTAGDTWNQYTVGSTRSYAYGIDNSDSQNFKFTTAASATVNPSTASDVYTFTPGTGFNYRNDGTTSFGIGIGTVPDIDNPLNIFKSLNDTVEILITNNNVGNIAQSAISIQGQNGLAQIAVPSSNFFQANVRDRFFLTCGVSSSGMAFSVPTGTDYHFYATAAAGIEYFFIGPNGLKSTAADAGATAGPIFTQYRNSSSPANNDIIGQIQHDGVNNAFSEKTFSTMTTTMTNVAAGAEEGSWELAVVTGGVLTPRLIITGTTYNISTSGLTGLTVTSTDAGASSGPILDLYRNSASPAISDLLGAITFTGNSSTGVKRQYGAILNQIISPTNTAESNAMVFQTLQAGAITNQMFLQPQGGQYRGFNGNTAAPAGFIGEVITASVASPGTTLSNATGANLTSIQVTAGNWILSAIVMFNGTVTGTIYQASISTVSLTNGVKGINFVEGTAVTSPTAVADTTLSIPPFANSFSTTTTVYLVTAAAFTVGTLKAYGSIYAVRVG